eukprot:TRINITY_DN2288_c0_g1_i1.p1 TRINITY_DN2288_c0_g1~~TRINITY_DN2288_c0_g1_i1.p1  ORF type:complete len:621 (+),score=97.55 TRINITY_DN2288_c0_g1_i1:46-1863(+)
MGCAIARERYDAVPQNLRNPSVLSPDVIMGHPQISASPGVGIGARSTTNMNDLNGEIDFSMASTGSSPSLLPRRSVVANGIEMPFSPLDFAQMDDDFMPPIIVTKENGGILSTNARVKRFLGVDQNVIGQHISMLFADRGMVVASMVQLPVGQRVVLHTSVKRYVDSDSTITVGVTVSHVAQNQTTYYLFFFHETDSTHKAAMSQVERHQSAYKEIFDHNADALISCSEDSTIVNVNKAAEALTEWKSSELLGQPFDKLVHPHIQQRCPNYVAYVLKRFPKSRVSVSFNMALYTKKGELIPTECLWVHISATPPPSPPPVRQGYSFTTVRSEDTSNTLMVSIRDQRARRKMQDAMLTEKILLNILPAKIALQLRNDPKQLIATHYKEVTILFSDLVGFTALSSVTPAADIVLVLNNIVRRFDWLCGRYGLEKIKTIGDAYMCAAGVPEARPDHAEAVVDFGIAALAALDEYNHASSKDLNMRVGVHSGEVIGGVVGARKILFDIFGDDVNIASRMESTGIGGRIQVSEATYNIISEKYTWERRDPIKVKGKGEMRTYLVVEKKKEFRVHGSGRSNTSSGGARLRNTSLPGPEAWSSHPGVLLSDQ